MIKHIDKRPKIAVKMKCQRCGSIWVYEGRQQYFVTCGKCYTKVSIARNKIGAVKEIE